MTKSWYRIELKPLAPIVVAARRQDEMQSSLDEIPGSTLRGVIGRRMMERGDDLELLCGVEQSWPWLSPSEEGALSLPLPRSARSCKRLPGLLGDHRGGRKPHGVSCELLATAASRFGGGLSPSSSCRSCGMPVKRIEGWYLENRKKQPELQRRRRMHVGIDRATGATRAGLLYGFESIMAPAFSGRVALTEEQAEKMRELLDEDAIVEVGRARTRGYGRCEMRIQRDRLGSELDLAKWSEDARKKLLIQGVPETVLPRRGCFFSLLLRSPLVQLDRLLRPVQGMPVLGLQEELLCSFTAVREVEGWNAALGRPRPTDQALARGSCGLYWSPVEAEEVEAKLQELTIQGLGERRQEGCGELDFGSRFFLEHAIPEENLSAI